MKYIHLSVMGFVLSSGHVAHAQDSAPDLPRPRSTRLCNFVPVSYTGPKNTELFVYDVEPQGLKSAQETLDSVFDVSVPGILDGYTNIYPARWDGGWGAEDDPVSVDTPYGRLLAALALLNTPPPPGYDGMAGWADEYVKKASPIEPSCADRDLFASTSHVPPRISIFASGFNHEVYKRAALLVHETRHTQFSALGGDWPFHDGPNQACTTPRDWEPGACCRGTSLSCDLRFENWRANSVEATYLASLARSESLRASLGRQRIFDLDDVDLAVHMTQAANELLFGWFAHDPGFRYTAGLGDPDLGLLEPLAGNEYEVFQEILPATGEVGTPETPMEGVETHFCFLTAVQGQFRREAQFLRIAKREYAGGQRWTLITGTRDDASLTWPELIRGSARCLPFAANPAVREYSVSHGDHVGEKWTRLDEEPVDGTNMCFLMGVGGAMQDSSHGVRVTERDGYWQVSTLSGHLEPGAQLQAKIGCIEAVWVSEHIRNVPGEFPLVCSEYQTEPANPGDAVYCGLTGVSGQFEGWEEFARVTPRGEVSSSEWTPWKLQIGENRAFHTVYGHAGCFVRPGFSNPQGELCP